MAHAPMLLLLALLSSGELEQGRSDDQYLFSRHGSMRPTGGFGGLRLKPTALTGSFGMMVGGAGGVILGDRLWLGGGGYGLGYSTYDAGRTDSGLRRQLNLGYGGFLIGGRLARSRFVDFWASGMIGGGGACKGLEWTDYDEEAEEYTCDDAVGLFVAEPEVGMHIFFSRWFRLGLAAGYRFTATAPTDAYGALDFWGPSASLQIEFGWF